VSEQPVMWATFCDDVRQEVGNKLSYIGVYGPELIVPSFPATLPKLCCVFNLRISPECMPRKLAFRLYRDEEIIFEAEQPPASEEALKELALRIDDSQWIWIALVAQLAPFQIPRAAVLRARAMVDDQEVKGGALRLRALSQPNPATKRNQ
jgi:hypothetical protein